MDWAVGSFNLSAQMRPTVGLYHLDDRAVEKVGRYVLISVIDKEPLLLNWTLQASSAIVRIRTLSPLLFGVFQK